MSAKTILWIALVGAGALTALIYFFFEAWLDQLLITLAKYDRWWSVVRLRPPSGQYDIISHASSKGAMAMIISDIPGHYFDDHDNDPRNWEWVAGMANPNPEKFPPPFLIKSRLEKNKLVWVGFNKAYYIQATEYAAWEKMANQSKYGLVSKERNKSSDDPHYFYQTVMAVKTEGAETKENYPLNIVSVQTVRHRYPVRVQFFAGKWTVRATAAIEGSVRQTTGGKSFKEMVGQSSHASGTKGDLIKAILELSEPDANGDPQSVTAKFGLEFSDPNFVSMEITPDSEHDKIAKATTAVSVAEQEAKSREKSAAGIRAEYEARVQAGKEHAGTFALAEAIKENKTASTLVIGSTNIAVPTGK